MNLAERAAQLRKLAPQVQEKLKSASRAATLRAMEKAAELTPPMQDDLRGTNTRTGEMKQHWASDSNPNPVRRGDQLVTDLANGKEYASYVNDGHRMDRHFVPGLVLNEASGMLEFNPDGKGGIVVGTRTKYVPGLHMVDAAKDAYRDTLQKELAGLEELIE